MVSKPYKFRNFQFTLYELERVIEEETVQKNFLNFVNNMNVNDLDAGTRKTSIRTLSEQVSEKSMSLIDELWLFLLSFSRPFRLPLR